MDANGARFWSLSRAADWTPVDDPDRVAWDARRGGLRLASQRSVELAEDAAVAGGLRAAVPDAVDLWGAVATVRSTGEGQAVVVHAQGALDRTIFSWEDEPGEITGLCIGEDGIISVVAGGRLHLRDSRGLGEAREDGRTDPGWRRGWRVVDPALLGAAPFTAWRAAPLAGGGGYLLDRAQGALARWTGGLLRAPVRASPAPGTFRPEPEDPESLALRVTWRGGFGGDEPVAIACSPDGRPAVLGLPAGGGEARVHLFDAEGRPAGSRVLDGVRQPYALAWIDAGRIAVLATDAPPPGAAPGTPGQPHPDALVYAVDGADDTRALLAGERYPLRSHAGGPFLAGPDGRVRYPSATGPRTLRALSLPHRLTVGGALGRALDSGRMDTCWHRLQVEAVVPPGCGIRLWLCTSEDGSPPADATWHPHDLGSVPGADPAVPRAAWVPAASELPGHPGHLDVARRLDQAGLFTVLAQRQGMRSRRLVGRHLHVRVTLHGTGRTSPHLFALRAWAPRFSYVRAYLPALYHEDPLLDAGPQPGPATPADFMERFVASFEGVLTPIEDRIAAAWQLTNPDLAPADALDWLAAWLGRGLDPALSEAARRRMVAVAPLLSVWRGTRTGMELALDVVTEGGRARGDFVVLEDWRLRRTWATILGADLAADEDPLLSGLAVSGNSFVGDTLVLGEEHHREFLALYGEELLAEDRAQARARLSRARSARTAVRAWLDLLRAARDQAAVDSFLADAAFRASVLLFDEADDVLLALVRRTVDAEAPATVRVEVKRASRPFIAGVSALVGVDTRLQAEPPIRTVRLGSSFVGAGDRVRRPPASLHPDQEGDGE